MKRITLFSVAAVLLFTGTASAGLIVRDYLTNGQLVVEDTETGNYWYQNLNDFVSMTYGEQITAIGGISPTYGNIAGGWHMASLAEMEDLWDEGETEITSAFGSPWAGGEGWSANTIGRYDTPLSFFSSHYVAGRVLGGWTPLDLWTTLDSSETPLLGAWVVTDATVVPLPPSVVMVTTGFLTLMGAKLRGRWRRR